MVRYLIKQLRLPFNAARRQGIITHNLAESVELPKPSELKDNREVSRDAFTPEQVESLMKAAVSQENGRAIFESGHEWSGAILFAYCTDYTGARLQNVANMQWASIDLPSKTITYRARKTGRRVVVPIHSALEN